jgi:hypothetical protein
MMACKSLISGGLVEPDCKGDKLEKKTEGNLGYWRLIVRKSIFATTGEPN